MKKRTHKGKRRKKQLELKELARKAAWVKHLADIENGKSLIGSYAGLDMINDNYFNDNYFIDAIAGYTLTRTRKKEKKKRVF